ncbi:MAG TPA: type I-B CRISPR-associated protein Cas5 [Candidatus Marinimicrobia bacterium]|nr:type I-B CRISPR-associated protein Cas5 [Candidatus Neomarinimicrobiota bacterium]
MKIVHFLLSGRFGHFLYAEANVSMPSYPFPPRTSIIGLIGAVIGIEKDISQIELEPTYIAISGKLPEKFWVTNKFHQSLPAKLPSTIYKNIKGSSSEVTNQKRLKQEWLFNPIYEIWVSLPEKYHDEFANRIKEHRWHFCPCLGISEHIADLQWISNETAIQLVKSKYSISSAFPESAGELDMDEIFDNQLILHCVRMPREVNKDRVFSHCNYYFERDMKTIPLVTDQAFEVENRKIIFM